MADNLQPTNYNQPQNEEKKQIKINAKVEKESFKSKVLNFLFSDKIDSIGTYLLSNILGPSIKRTVFQMGISALGMALLGDANVQVPQQQSSGLSSGQYIPGYGWVSNTAGNFNYNQISAQSYIPAVSSPNVPMPTATMNTISYGSKDQAYLVLDRLKNALRQYGKVKVRDVYQCSEITPPFGNWTIEGYGWYNLDTVVPRECTNGRWILEYPPMQLVN